MLQVSAVYPYHESNINNSNNDNNDNNFIVHCNSARLYSQCGCTWAARLGVGKGGGKV